MSTTFQAQIFQNSFLPQGSGSVHAVVSVRAEGGAGEAQRSNAPLAIGIILDCSGSMGEESGIRLNQAKQGVRAVLDLLRPDCYFFLIAGWDDVEVLAPLELATADNRRKALAALARTEAGGGTQMSKWLMAAKHQFPANSLYIRQAILLTDGMNETADAAYLEKALAACEGRFQCDARGVGVNWHVEQLRTVATRLLGSVDIIAEPANIAEDFQTILKTTLSKTVSEARLRLWTPVGTKVEFCKQVSPSIVDLTSNAIPNPQTPNQVRDYPLGAWGGREERDYHLNLTVKPGAVGQRMLAGRVSLIVSDGTTETKMADGQILANWTDDETRSAIISPEVAHYTGQGELAEVIKQGLEARRVGDEEGATRKLGRAVQLAAESGNDATTKLLKKVVDVIDEDTGTIKLRRAVDDADEMALDTRSTKTTRRISPQ